MNRVKQFALVLFICIGINSYSQEHQLHKLWETPPVVAIPESVLYDGKGDILYVSLIDGSPWEADGKGGIARLSKDGKNYDSSWITGLNAPKGLGIHQNLLYAADITEVVVIDIPGKKVVKKIKIPGSEMLNDITVSENGIVYVSDSKTGKIHRIEQGTPDLYMENISGINGLKAIGDELYIGAGKAFLKADKNKATTTIAELPEGIDGIEPIGNGDFVLTSWVGLVYYVKGDGSVQVLLDSRENKKNAADLGFNPKTRTVYIPTFMGKTVAAYHLQ